MRVNKLETKNCIIFFNDLPQKDIKITEVKTWKNVDLKETLKWLENKNSYFEKKFFSHSQITKGD